MGITKESKSSPADLLLSCCLRLEYITMVGSVFGGIEEAHVNANIGFQGGNANNFV